MKTSISFTALPSRSSRMVEASRGATTSAIGSARRARLRLQVGAAVDPRHARQEIIDFRFCGGCDGGARLALGAGSDDAAFLQHIFAHREPRTRLLLVTDQRQMRVEDIMHGIALAFLPEPHH